MTRKPGKARKMDYERMKRFVFNNASALTVIVGTILYTLAWVHFVEKKF